MPNALDKNALLLQNLKDAGCGKKLTEECMSCYNGKEYETLLEKLAVHRKRVLLQTRLKQKQLDCLDHLTNKIKKNEY